MLMDKYRPILFSDIVGQGEVKKVLRGVIKGGSIRNIILYGPYGVGKTSVARAFAREIGGELVEFDVSVMGRVDEIKGIRELIENRYVWKGNRVVVVFDEMQEASRRAQSLLLSILERGYDSIYFIFTTTDRGKLLDTIRSRCIEVGLGLLSMGDIELYIDRIIELEGIEISDSDKELIIRRSGGHLRDAVNNLELYLMNADLLRVVDLDFFSVDLDELRGYSVVSLKEMLERFIERWVGENIDSNYVKVVKVLDLYLMYKKNIVSFIDLINVIKVLRKVVNE